jgi:hypothetical protein
MPSTKAALEDFSELDQAYRLAFRNWSSQIHHLQAVADHPIDEQESRQAHHLVEAAESDYRDRRDRLAGYILTGTRFSRLFPKDRDSSLTEEQRSEIERVAYRLWEEAGRPDGTAESDWLRAERIVLDREKAAAAGC